MLELKNSMGFLKKIFSLKKNEVRNSYQVSDIPKIESENGEMHFGYNQDAFAHLVIQSIEKKTGQRLTNKEYKQVLGDLKKTEIETKIDNYDFKDDTDYSDDQKEHIVHNAVCSFLDFVDNRSYSKVHSLFSILSSNQKKLKELSKTYPRYDKVSKIALENMNNVSQNLKKFIKNPDLDLQFMLKKQEDELFSQFKYYRESSMSRFKKKEIINKHRAALINEIDEILTCVDKDSHYHVLLSEYKVFNLSIINERKKEN
jgi:hypothetical protein